MSKRTYYRAKTLLKRKQVHLTSISRTLLCFESGGKEVKYKKQNKRWLCTCFHETYRKEGKLCSHIKACKMWLEEKRKNANTRKNKKVIE